MQIIFEKTSNHDLTVYIHTFTAVDNDILTEKLHVHSEYDTDWSNKLTEWSEHYKWYRYETMRGHETCMTILKFIQVTSVEDLIIDINTYLRKGDDLHKETGVYMVNYRTLNENKSL